jgi:uncharacterized membrane protein (UPF0127 family)
VIRNRRTGLVLADRLRWAVTPPERARGLLDRASLEAGEGLLISPCNSVHMFGMRFPIDVAFLSREGVVVRAIPGLRPGQWTRLHLRARHALELPVGTLSATGTERGDTLDMPPVPAGARGYPWLPLLIASLLAAAFLLRRLVSGL